MQRPSPRVAHRPAAPAAAMPKAGPPLPASLLALLSSPTLPLHRHAPARLSRPPPFAPLAASRRGQELQRVATLCCARRSACAVSSSSASDGQLHQWRRHPELLRRRRRRRSALADRSRRARPSWRRRAKVDYAPPAARAATRCAVCLGQAANLRGVREFTPRTFHRCCAPHRWRRRQPPLRRAPQASPRWRVRRRGRGRTRCAAPLSLPVRQPPSRRARPCWPTRQRAAPTVARRRYAPAVTSASPSGPSASNTATKAAASRLAADSPWCGASPATTVARLPARTASSAAARSASARCPASAEASDTPARKSLARPAVSDQSSLGTTLSALSEVRQRHAAGWAHLPSSHILSISTALALLAAASCGRFVAVPWSANHTRLSFDSAASSCVRSGSPP
eukprot:6213126-Pleurochrysis_carterae.AAC.3